MIGPALSMLEGNLFEWEGGQTYLPAQIKHELADWSDSQAAVSQFWRENLTGKQQQR